MKAVVLSNNENETRRVGGQIARGLTSGDIVLLYGEMGVGKTAFVKGVAEGLGVCAEEVTSPTYTIIQQYEGETTTLFHADLYRIADMDELFETGFEECLFTDSIILIEWPQLAEALLSGVEVKTVHIEKIEDGKRRITLAREMK